MIFRALDADGDWVFGAGQQSYLTGSNAIALNIETALYCFQNDCFWNMAFGIDWWNLLGKRGTQPQIILQCREVIQNCYGVAQLESVSANLDAQRHLDVTYDIDTIYSTKIANSVSPTT